MYGDALGVEWREKNWMLLLLYVHFLFGEVVGWWDVLVWEMVLLQR